MCHAIFLKIICQIFFYVLPCDECVVLSASASCEKYTKFLSFICLNYEFSKACLRLVHKRWSGEFDFH